MTDSANPGGPGGPVARLRRLYAEFPAQFWIVVLGTFIDRLGGALLFPFFTLYLTRKFNIGMTEVGFIFGVFALSSVAGSIAGGALTDRLGRKIMLLFGLVMSAVFSLSMGIIDNLQLFFIAALVVGVFSEVGAPAQQALVADLLDEEQRAQGFGILRVVANLAVTIGPIIGGFLASRSYLLLFITDAVTSLITAGFIFFALRETRRAPAQGEPQESMAATFRGYSTVLTDRAFLWFMVASMLMVMVYMNMNTTLAVYLRDVHGVPEQGFGYILSMNAAMVVLFQFGITRRITRYRPLVIMAIGTLLYALGFAMYGFVSVFPLFLLAMAIITVGEMFVTPIGQAIVARLAPEDKRGRYMAAYGFSWVLPMAAGPLLAGLVMDNFNPSWLWYAAGLVGLAAAGAYYLLELRVSRVRWAAVDRRVDILEQVEEGRITAEEASRLLEGVGEGSWARLAPEPAGEAPARRHVRIRVSDLASGAMKVDLRLPVGLVNTVLYMGGRLSADLEGYDPLALQQLITQGDAGGGGTRTLDGDDDRLEISIE